jgi:hypothetical protein
MADDLTKVYNKISDYSIILVGSGHFNFYKVLRNRNV